MLDQHDLLVGRVGVHRMRRDQLRRSAEHRLDLALRVGDARIGPAASAPGRRRRLARFVPEQRVQAGIAREHAVEHGGAGAREPDDHDRRADPLLEDLRMAPDALLGAQPVHEQADDALLLAEPAGC